MQNLRKITLNNSGQALLFVIVSLTVALAIVTSIALRNLSSTSRVTQTDSSYRVTATAEGGAERYLNLTSTQLLALTSSPNLSKCQAAGSTNVTFTGSPRNACVVNFPGTGSDNISANAYVTVAISPSDPTQFRVKLKKDEVYELNLRGYGASSVIMNWRRDGGSTQSPVLYLLGYDSASNSPSVKKVYCPAGGCGLLSNYSGSESAAAFNDTSVNPAVVYERVTVSSLGSTQALRVRAVGADAELWFLATEGRQIPNQGFMIESVGELSNNSVVSATKTVQVFKSSNYLPAMFDFSIFNNGARIQ